MIFKDENFNAKLLLTVIFSIVLFLTIFICGKIQVSNESLINEQSNAIAWGGAKVWITKI